MELTLCENLMFNLSSGLKPCELTKDECNLMIKEYGDNWFYKLGYDDSYEKPKY